MHYHRHKHVNPSSKGYKQSAEDIPSSGRGSTVSKVALLLVGGSPTAVLRPESTAGFLSIGESTLWEKLNTKSRYHDPDMPLPVELGGRNRGFLVSELLAYLDLKAAQRSQGKR